MPTHDARRSSAGGRTIFLSTYIPQKCGIATFTHDLARSIAELPTRQRVQIAAVAEDPSRLVYPDDVVISIPRNDRRSYIDAAAWVNRNAPDATVCVQHEFGIFGGDEGGYLIDFLTNVRRPVVTTLHTVLSSPAPHYHRRLRNVADLSDRVVVLTPSATTILRDVYRIAGERVRVIPHGIPDLPFVESASWKELLGVADRTLLLTFGLIGPSKGIEDVLRALPPLVKAHPDLLYIVAGSTHPGVLASDGESYRESLHALVRELGLGEHVAFHNHYMGNEELYTYLKAADIYVTPYPNRDQISSGTLAFAAGLGKPIVSTPFHYAVDLLGNGRGELAEFRSPESIGDGIGKFLRSPQLREQVRRRAYAHGRTMTWNRVAASYVSLFHEVAAAAAAPQLMEGKRRLPVDEPRRMPILGGGGGQPHGVAGTTEL